MWYLLFYNSQGVLRVSGAATWTNQQDALDYARERLVGRYNPFRYFVVTKKEYEDLWKGQIGEVISFTS